MILPTVNAIRNEIGRQGQAKIREKIARTSRYICDDHKADHEHSANEYVMKQINCLLEWPMVAAVDQERFLAGIERAKETIDRTIWIFR